METVERFAAYQKFLGLLIPKDSLLWPGITNTALFSALVALFYKKVHFVPWLQSSCPTGNRPSLSQAIRSYCAAGHFCLLFVPFFYFSFFLFATLVSGLALSKKRCYCFGFYYQLPLKPKAVKLCLRNFQRDSNKNFKLLGGQLWKTKGRFRSMRERTCRCKLLARKKREMWIFVALAKMLSYLCLI